MFIELTYADTDEEKILINTRHIILIAKETPVTIHTTDRDCFEVKETYEQVKQLIKEQLEK